MGGAEPPLPGYRRLFLAPLPAESGSAPRRDSAEPRPRGSDDKRIRLQRKRPGFDPWVGKIPWRRASLPTPVFLPGESPGQRSLVGYSPWGRIISREKPHTGAANYNPPAQVLPLVPWEAAFFAQVCERPGCWAGVHRPGVLPGPGVSRSSIPRGCRAGTGMLQPCCQTLLGMPSDSQGAWGHPEVKASGQAAPWP